MEKWASREVYIHNLQDIYNKKDSKELNPFDNFRDNNSGLFIFSNLSFYDLGLKMNGYENLWILDRNSCYSCRKIKQQSEYS